MVFGSIVTDLLAELDFLQLPDEPWSEDERNEEGGDRRVNDSKAQIPEAALELPTMTSTTNTT